jgi:hypothetical protein
VQILAPKGVLTHGHPVRLVKDVLATEEQFLGASLHPKQHSELKLNSTSYQVLESLTPKEEGNGPVWCGNDMKLFYLICQVQKINDEVISSEIFGPAHSGIRYRACCCLQGGNYNVSTIVQYAPVSVINWQ